MHRFYLPPQQCREASVFLAGREAHHALDVLRLKRSERVTILDGAGQELLCEVQDHDRDKLQLAVVERRIAPPPPCRITLFQAVPKAKLIESIIQKATELGAARIVPVLSERVILHVNEREAALKAAKWQAVAIEAIKQCGAHWLPAVEIPRKTTPILSSTEASEVTLIASLQPGAKHPRHYFQEFKSRHGRQPASVSVWVGPEGDYTPEEVAQIQSHGVQPITLGPLVLRCETAATYCLSVLNYELS